MKLIEDFNSWWDLPRYKNELIEATQFSDVEILVRHGSNQGWPGPEKEVQYWVELENGIAVGAITPKKKISTFPFYKIV